ncbi:unnamed protein product (macronuclear) [Paramecium tetraurelia]|uniref:Uncharacterized protein n=1 Tax=Paramecium tetraurelia TaxID=5888 RepID=A0BJL3_PARTE|nr:uncharacterized protein GSPATT00029358001 [Paramecium tetraurelia]CAK58730.1 unnamed protein product [Paramecium tetraurelia]|eukprot:XP_001426128.1 hypothetical protein (macronuclear) [Paramecium tetraurelia strain d4-2]
MEQSHSKAFTYNLLPQYSINQNSSPRAIAINKNNTLLVVEAYYFVKFFTFKRGEIRLLQRFEFRNSNHNTLNFQMQKQDIVSSSQKFVCKYSSKLMANPKYIQKCSGQFNANCLILHPLNEDIIIVGSLLGQIDFLFTNQSGSIKPFKQTIKEHSSVLGLSINNDGKRVISCGKDNFILILEPNSTNSELSTYIWTVKQKLFVEQYGYRICFINNDKFTFQPSHSPYMNLYCEINGFFLLKSQHLLSSDKNDPRCIFQQVYNKQKSLIYNIYGRALQIIRLSKDQSLQTDKSEESFQLEQLIDFGNNYNPWIFGVISEDAEYIITWDFYSEQIQIRQFQNTE